MATAISQPPIIQAKEICRLLGWTELDYNTFMWQTGTEYLDYYLPNDNWGKQMLEQNKTYWNWWKNQWANRDAEFLQNVKGDRNALALCYMLEYHDAKMLSEEIYPAGVKIGCSYKVMVQNIIDEVNGVRV